MILLDTSGLLAALSPDQRKHRECARVLAEARPPRILSPFVLAELDSLVEKYLGVTSEVLLLREVSRRAYELASFDSTDVNESIEIIEKYRSLQLGLADASILVLSARYKTRDVLTLDERHFRAVRHHGRPFRVLPADRQ